ncbi:MAG: thermonuclease family protein [Alphaproteobacteria bacterium]|nr:thermonuclease family protein [Alphaproteobacteria bacterium]
MKRIGLALLVALAAASAGAKTFGSIEGPATAKDGDDVIVQGIDIRLQGIAAPEDSNSRREPGGPESTASLSAIVAGGPVRCELDGTKARGRPVAICYINGRDIGELQVFAGHARDCPRFSRGRYAKAETLAQAEGRNLSSTYSLPSYCR